MTAALLNNNRIMQIGLVVHNIEDAVQAWSRLLGAWDLSVRRRNPVVWDVARTTKKLD